MNREIESTSFLLGADIGVIEALYRRYLEDPAALDPSWRRVFEDLGDDLAAVLAQSGGPAWARRPAGAEETPPAPGAGPAPAGAEAVRMAALDSVRALMLIRAYRVRGHLIADLDPLGLEGEKHHPELDPASYGFTERDFDRPIYVAGVLGLEQGSLREILHVLKETYCRTVGIEFMHIQVPEQKSWIQERVEASRNRAQLSRQEKLDILRQLDESEGFERFLNIKYPGNKRFSLEGAESTIPVLEALIARAVDLGVEEIVLGMAHRGRLNVLTSVIGKSYAAVFSEFQGEAAYSDDVQGSGDVKYHLGASADRELPGGRRVHLSLTPNPSHLEAVDPVVQGKVRAKQTRRADAERSQVLGVLLHGDAAFAGQGIVAECFGLSELRGYRTGGTVHLIINNQIGFTTSPSYARSSPYPSDIAKAVQAPIFHVNGDDAEAVVHVARLAVEFRQRFKKDVVIDMFCYRRHGHNEADEPAFTQPLMYRRISEHPTTRQIYTEKLVAKGDLTVKEADQRIDAFHARLEEELEASKHYRPNKADWLEGYWSRLEAPRGNGPAAPTGIASATLEEIGRAITHVPEGFRAHPRLVKLLDAKRHAIEAGGPVDWATAEALAFGSLLLEGHPVRLSGQDSARGTFSQRHARLIDQLTEERYVPLNHIRAGQAPFEVVDSMLSEAAVLGFEYGYSITDPDALVLWEAQFGDFANGAQAIIDQFVASGEAKWLRMSGLVMLLPHGFEGQGPEHSSARVERYLQLYGEHNMHVVNCSTPANFFHVLRRQLKRSYRKPLVVFTPKSLLRNKRCVSTLADMAEGTGFAEVIAEARDDDANVRRVVMCTGKVYYDLLAEREKQALRDVVFVRLEELAPFPAEALERALAPYAGAEMIWCQEEPRNMGAWFFVAPHIEAALEALGARQRRPLYIGRQESAAPATGFLKVHLREQQALVAQALGVGEASRHEGKRKSA